MKSRHIFGELRQLPRVSASDAKESFSGEAGRILMVAAEDAASFSWDRRAREYRISTPCAPSGRAIRGGVAVSASRKLACQLRGASACAFGCGRSNTRGRRVSCWTSARGAGTSRTAGAERLEARDRGRPKHTSSLNSPSGWKSALGTAVDMSSTRARLLVELAAPTPAWFDGRTTRFCPRPPPAGANSPWTGRHRSSTN